MRLFLPYLIACLLLVVQFGCTGDNTSLPTDTNRSGPTPEMPSDNGGGSPPNVKYDCIW